jgi:large subunit ribosomal protein L1
VGVNEVLQVRNYAARKGTREKARKKKVKVEVKKAAYVPYYLRKKK